MSDTLLEKRKPSIEDWIEVFAKYGETEAPLRLYITQIRRLEKKGLKVKVLAPTDRPYQYFCKADWKEPSVPNSFATRMLQLTIDALRNNLI